MGQRIVDDNGVQDFTTDTGVQCFVDDLGNFTCPGGPPPPRYFAASEWCIIFVMAMSSLAALL